jgi:hypothetical protein
VGQEGVIADSISSGAMFKSINIQQPGGSRLLEFKQASANKEECQVETSDKATPHSNINLLVGAREDRLSHGESHKFGSQCAFSKHWLC